MLKKWVRLVEDVRLNLTVQDGIVCDWASISGLLFQEIALEKFSGNWKVIELFASFLMAYPDVRERWKHVEMEQSIPLVVACSQPSEFFLFGCVPSEKLHEIQVGALCFGSTPVLMISASDDSITAECVNEILKVSPGGLFVVSSFESYEEEIQLVKSYNCVGTSSSWNILHPDFYDPQALQNHVKVRWVENASATKFEKCVINRCMNIFSSKKTARIALVKPTTRVIQKAQEQGAQGLNGISDAVKELLQYYSEHFGVKMQSFDRNDVHFLGIHVLGNSPAKSIAQVQKILNMIAPSCDRQSISQQSRSCDVFVQSYAGVTFLLWSVLQSSLLQRNFSINFEIDYEIDKAWQCGEVDYLRCKGDAVSDFSTKEDLYLPSQEFLFKSQSQSNPLSERKAWNIPYQAATRLVKKLRSVSK